MINAQMTAELIDDWLGCEGGDDAREHELLVRLAAEPAPPT